MDDEEGRQRRQGEEDEEDLMEWEAPYYKDTCLWLIDNAPSMHRVDPESGKSYVQRSIEVACKMMEHKLIKSPSDRIGILLYNTKETRVPVEGKKMTYPGCYAVQNIAQVGVPAVMELRDELAEADRSSEGAVEWFKQRYPSDQGQVRIHYALSNAESMLNSAGKTGSRRIFFVTNIDDPYQGRSAKHKLQLNALEKIKDMRRRGIEFEAFFISMEDHVFDVGAFYGDLFQAYDDEGEHLRGDVSLGGGNDSSTKGRSSWNAFDKFDDLEKDAGAREQPKRVVFRLGMELADGFVIGIAGYNLVVRATKGFPVKVYRADEDEVWQEVVTTTHLQCRDTGKLLNPHTQVHHAFALGFDNSPRSVVRFTPDEINALKTSGLQPGLKVLGFKDRVELRFWENVKHSVFIFPTEAEYIGSQRAFSALLRVMLAKDKMAIGVFMPRPTSIPEFVAILPQAEQRSEEGTQIEPPGMHLVPLPFADDIREMPAAFANPMRATDEEAAAAGRFVKAYTRNAAFNPDFFPNPALNHHYEALKAVAFGVDIAEPRDKSLPDYDAIEKRAGRLVSAWDDLCRRDERTKRGGGRSSGGADGQPLPLSDQKRPLMWDGDEEDKLLGIHTSGQLEKKTVDYLKMACEHYRLPKSGKKAELVQRLEYHLDKVLSRKSSAASR
ncbi:unnamed protein product [Jaminaea pallidilutea]